MNKALNKRRLRRQFIIGFSFFIVLLVIVYFLFRYGAFQPEYVKIEREQVDPRYSQL